MLWAHGICLHPLYISLCPRVSFVSKGGERMEAYCMKCRKKVEIKNPLKVTMKNGKPATQGVCPLNICL